jgi:acylglycerol lipase
VAGTDATTTACCGGASCRILPNLVYRGGISARTGAKILTMMQRLPAALPRLSVPLLVLHDTDDQICPLAGSVMAHEAVSSADKTQRRYPNLYHEVFNEPEREQILTDLIFWLTAHLPSNGSAAHSAG